MKNAAYKILPIIGKTIVLLSLTYVIAKNVDFQRVVETFANMNWGFFSLAVAMMFLMPLLLAIRLAYVASLPMAGMLLCILKSYFFNNFFPAQIGGDFYKVYYLTKIFGEKKKATAVIIGDRIIGISGLILFCLTNVLLGWKYFTDPRIYAGVGLYVLAVMVGLAAVFLLPESWFVIVGRLLKLHSLMDKLHKIRLYAKDALRTKFMLGLILTFAAYGMLVLVNIMAMLAFNYRVAVMASVLYIPVISIAVITLPISFNGLGVRESLFILFFGMAGYTPDEGLTMAIVNLLCLLAVSVAGALLLLFGKILPAIHGKGEEVLSD